MARRSSPNGFVAVLIKLDAGQLQRLDLEVTARRNEAGKGVTIYRTDVIRDFVDQALEAVCKRRGDVTPYKVPVTDEELRRDAESEPEAPRKGKASKAPEAVPKYPEVLFDASAHVGEGGFNEVYPAGEGDEGPEPARRVRKKVDEAGGALATRSRQEVQEGAEVREEMIAGVGVEDIAVEVDGDKGRSGGNPEPAAEAVPGAVVGDRGRFGSSVSVRRV